MVSQNKTERNIETHRRKSFLIYRHFVYFVVWVFLVYFVFGYLLDILFFGGGEWWILWGGVWGAWMVCCVWRVWFCSDDMDDDAGNTDQWWCPRLPNTLREVFGPSNIPKTSLNTFSGGIQGSLVMRMRMRMRMMMMMMMMMCFWGGPLFEVDFHVVFFSGEPTEVALLWCAGGRPQSISPCCAGHAPGTITSRSDGLDVAMLSHVSWLVNLTPRAKIRKPTEKGLMKTHGFFPNLRPGY